MVPRRTARRLLAWAAVGYVAFSVGTVGAVWWWTSDVTQEIRVGQVGACERGNVLRLQMAEDNAIAIQAARTQLAHPAGLTAGELEALESSVTRRSARASELAPYPCQTLR